jgi:hypothetical protein
MKSLPQRYRLILPLLVCVLSLGTARGALAANEPSQGPVHQLRIDEIFEHNKQAFHDRFRDHAMRIMAKYDFRIVAMWESRTNGRTEFVYVLEWPDKQTLKDRWAKFMADPEWAEIKRQTARAHGQLVGEIQDRVLQATEYSPRKQLLSPRS